MTKAQIVDEIRRAAAQNGGKAPGWRKFLAETGIRESDWLGVHWARWSDAVREAGLEPNQLNEAFPDEVLLDHLAELATELGRLPNRGDHRFREARGTPFPNNKVFARLGGQAQRVGRLRQHCIERPRWAGVVAYCDAFLSKRSAPTKPGRDDAGIVGVVYMLRSGKHFKIGRSNALGRREYELSLQLPERASVVHSINTDDPVGIEAYWHRRFELKRANGEWFSLEAKDVAAFRRRKFM
jgi:hypothetical protein